MDESLALLSQGIESVITRTEAGSWALDVAPEMYRRALSVLELYRRENRRWPWRRPIHGSVLFDWGCLAWVALLIAFYLFEGSGRVDLRQAGILDGSKVAKGEWWRLFTPVFLHADPGHLIANAVFGTLFLGLAMGTYGTGIGLLASYLAGVGGNLMAWLVDPAHRSLGASGMVMGCLGLLAARFATTRKSDPWARKSMLGATGAVTMLFLLLGSSAGSDVQAHLGGCVSGFLAGLALRTRPRLASNGFANLLAGAVFCLLAIVTWELAIRHG